MSRIVSGRAIVGWASGGRFAGGPPGDTTFTPWPGKCGSADSPFGPTVIGPLAPRDTCGVLTVTYPPGVPLERPSAWSPQLTRPDSPTAFDTAASGRRSVTAAVRLVPSGEARAEW